MIPFIEKKDTYVTGNEIPMSKSQTVARQGIVVHNKSSASAYVDDA